MKNSRFTGSIVFGFISLFVTTVTLNSTTASGNGKDHHYKEGHHHKEYQQIVNPVKSTPEILQDAAKIYEQNCSDCHGETGKGDGSVGKELTPPAADFTDGTWRHGSTNGEIYSVIAKGIPNSDMIGWKSTLSDKDIWKLVHLLKGFSSTTKHNNPVQRQDKSNHPDKSHKSAMHSSSSMTHDCDHKEDPTHKCENHKGHHQD